MAPIRLCSLAKETFTNSKFLPKILNHLSMVDIKTTEQITREFGPLVRKYIQGRVDDALRPWLDDPSDFRRFLSLTHSLIIGSLPLHVLLLPNVRWRPDQLTLASPNGWSSLEMVKYLQDVEDYAQDEGASFASKGPSSPFSHLITLRRSREVDGVERVSSVVVVESDNDHPERVVVHLQSTCLMCYMTHDSLYSLYPRWTMNRVAIAHPLISALLEGSRRFRWLRKYNRRGFQIYASTDDASIPCSDGCPLVWRNTKDLAVLRIHYGLANDPTHPLEDTRGFSWCFSDGTDMPAVCCRNIFCSRSSLMLPRRDKKRPEAPYHNGYASSAIVTLTNAFFGIE